jgi:hypothetical protein
MANEFKIKKGLIVTGALGGTVVDIQGSQGQLFSVTDDLSGSIFAVSDISGVPILDINSSGLSTFDGSVDITSGALSISADGSNAVTLTESGSGDFTIDAPDDIRLDAGGGDVVYKAAGTEYARLKNNNPGVVLSSSANNSSIYLSPNGIGNLYATTDTLIIQGDEGETTALLLRTDQGDDDGDDWYIINQVSNQLVFTNNVSGSQVDQLTLAPNSTASDSTATFVGQAFSAGTSSGDASSTLTTKGYVDGLITGATIYRGAWDPSNGGYGSPDLSGVTQTSGYYYICSAAGAAEPNGTGTEPDTWAVGDWVIYNDVSGTGQWQKIDNSSVLSGVGTGQTVALWEGAGSVTDSDTLGNAPITVSGSNVGIGTTSPGFILDIDSGTANSALRVLSTDRYTGIRFEDVSNDDTLFYDGQSDLMYLSNSNFRAVDIYATGNIGVGTSSPSAKLEVSYTDTGIGAIVGNTTHNSRLQIYTAAAGKNSEIWFGDAEDDNVGVIDYDHANDSMSFVTSNLPRMRIDSAGDVGIGHTSPLAKLHVQDTSFPQVRINDDTNQGESGIRFRSFDGVNQGVHGDIFVASTGGTEVGRMGFRIPYNGTEKLTILSSGNVGIGTTSPARLLSIGDGTGSPNIQLLAAPAGNSRIEFGDTDDSDAGEIQYVHSSNYMQFTTNGTERMRINAAGSVGIGTTSPNYKLSVSGAIQGGGKITYTKVASSLNTTGYDVAGILASSSGNGLSCGFTFTCFGQANYQKIVYSCYNTSGTWNAIKLIDEGTDKLDIVVSAISGSTITFKYKTRSGTLYYTPRVIVEAVGSSINSTYA